MTSSVVHANPIRSRRPAQRLAYWPARCWHRSRPRVGPPGRAVGPAVEVAFDWNDSLRMSMTPIWPVGRTRPSSPRAAILRDRPRLDPISPGPPSGSSPTVRRRPRRRRPLCRGVPPARRPARDGRRCHAARPTGHGVSDGRPRGCRGRAVCWRAASEPSTRSWQVPGSTSASSTCDAAGPATRSVGSIVAARLRSSRPTSRSINWASPIGGSATRRRRIGTADAANNFGLGERRDGQVRDECDAGGRPARDQWAVFRVRRPLTKLSKTNLPRSSAPQ